MKLKKSMFVVPMSLMLLMPTAALADDHGDHSEHAESGMEMGTATPAAELRITLDTALTEHAFLAIEAMRKGVDGAEDFDQAAAALTANSDDIAAAVSSVYGEENGAAFLEIWNSHIGYFVDYVTATAEEDQEGIDQALAQLEEYKVEQAAFFATATEDRLPAAALEEGLQMHIDMLLMTFDAYAEGDFETAYTHEREAIMHMSGFAEQLSVAIADQFPDQFEGTNPDTPAVDLRAQLNYVFTEHAGLAAMAMQDGADGAESFDQAAGALTANADDLSAAVASVYGEEAGAQFAETWNSHIGYFVDYVVATGEGDTEGQEAAKAELDGYIVEQAAFLDTATEGRTPAPALEEGLTAHVDQLLTAFDSYVAGDYDTAYNSIRDAWAHMTMPAAGLSAAITDQFPEQFGHEMPAEMPNTGMGGAADENGFPIGYLIALLFVMVGGSAIAVRKFASDNK
ncbi:copper amine oxidase [Jeotgalibacillus salarius]|uniref:Copper amine oxidase n=1 Tax=Jeotgalibacillus salarius TaxID=546023 RepID=A0A4Y8L763_9BACL|nr:copper amine oxidase [Jeotgalibacillus salarius]TFD98423.1 copper amine oxidase [Jeotgalibacillus salarius]